MKSDTSTRFAFIETRLQWEQGVTARELAEVFHITRQTAQGVIDDYRNHYPENIRLDKSRKKQVAAEAFSPRYISPDAGHFMDYLRGRGLMDYYLEQTEWSGFDLIDVDRLTRPRLAISSTQALLQALRNKQSLEVDYCAKSGRRHRDICPHSILFASNRYHLRAYCHLSKQFLDFVVSRILDFKPSQAPWISQKEDADWNTYIEMLFQVNDDLPAEAKRAICQDYRLQVGEILTITCRKALAFYVRRQLLAVDQKYGLSRWVDINNKD